MASSTTTELLSANMIPTDRKLDRATPRPGLWRGRSELITKYTMLCKTHHNLLTILQGFYVIGIISVLILITFVVVHIFTTKKIISVAVLGNCWCMLTYRQVLYYSGKHRDGAYLRFHFIPILGERTYSLCSRKWIGLWEVDVLSWVPWFNNVFSYESFSSTIPWPLVFRSSLSNLETGSRDEIDDVVPLSNLNPKGHKVSIKRLPLLDGYGVYEAELNIISGVWACFDVALKRLS